MNDLKNQLSSVSNTGQQGTRQLGIGIDFGTSNSVAAIFDGQKITRVRLEEDSPIMPSATYIDRDLITSTGQNAIDTYISRNQGRRVELSAEVIGEARSAPGQVDISFQKAGEGESEMVYGQSFNDGSLPGRLFRGTKRLLSSADIQRIMVFERPFRLVALITPILLRIRQAIESTLQTLSISTTEAAHACIGHPVNFEGQDPNHNKVALDRLSESYKYAGVTQQVFYPEPTAATLSYLHEHPDQQNDVILTVDFGGGTLDLCILKRNESLFDIVAIHGIGLGGDHIDQAMFRQLLFPLLGKGERWQREMDGKTVDTLFPFDNYESLLLNWTVSYMLNQNEYTSPVLDKIQQNDASVDKFQRLYEIITQNYSYQVFQALKDCKAKLSSNDAVMLDIPEIDVEIEVRRDDFETMIASQLADFEKAVTDTLAKANLQPGDIQLVLRTGGSSLIPAVKNILDKYFPGKVVEHDAFTSVATGLALADYYGYGIKLD